MYLTNVSIYLDIIFENMIDFKSFCTTLIHKTFVNEKLEL